MADNIKAGIISGLIVAACLEAARIILVYIVS